MSENAENMETEGKISNIIDFLPDGIEEALEKVPEKERHMILEQLSVMSVMSQQAPESAVSKKLTSEHISQYLNDAGLNMRLTHKGKTQNKFIALTLAIVFIGFLCFVITVFKDKPEFIEKIIYASGGGILGFAGGFGFGKTKRDD